MKKKISLKKLSLKVNKISSLKATNITGGKFAEAITSPTNPSKETKCYCLAFA